MPNLLRNQSVIFLAIVYEISKSVIPLSNSVIMYLVIGFITFKLIHDDTRIFIIEFSFLKRDIGTPGLMNCQVW